MKPPLAKLIFCAAIITISGCSEEDVHVYVENCNTWQLINESEVFCKMTYEIRASVLKISALSNQTGSFTVQYLVNGTSQKDKKLKITSKNPTCLKITNEIITAPNETIVNYNTGSCNETTAITITDPENQAEPTTISVQITNNNVSDPPDKNPDLNDTDLNGNHLWDSYETAPRQGEDCRYYSDCDSAPGAGDGFCDSFIDYKCSTKCTSDKQCVDSDNPDYQFVCRPDGRCAPDTFITEWDLTGEPSRNAIIRTDLATRCDATIDWGDGSAIEKLQNCPHENWLKHTYPQNSKYIIKIKGIFDNWSRGTLFAYDNSGSTVGFSTTTDGKYLSKVITFGPVGLGDMTFYATKIMAVSDIDIPDATKLLSIAGSFCQTNINCDLNRWDVSNVTDMKYAFYHSQFNGKINKWDTSKVSQMNGMFGFAKIFNQDLDWNTSNVTNMNHMFNYAHAFDRDISRWDTSNVTDMNNMFSDASVFHADISKWDTHNVTNMARMFANASAFHADISKWDTHNVTNMEGMFFRTLIFNADISKWDTHNVQDMNYMFAYTTFFNQDLSQWDLSSIPKYSNDNHYGDAKGLYWILNDSTFSKENYCKLFSNKSKYKAVWLDYQSKLGIHYSCL